MKNELNRPAGPASASRPGGTIAATGIRFFLLYGVLLGAPPKLFASTTEPPPPLTERITSAAVFYQPLVPLGEVPLSEAENQMLLTEIQKIRDRDGEPDLAGLERFLTDHPDSPWAASLHANLGRYDYEHGLYTRALEHWQTAWNATRTATNGPLKGVADFAFANWVNLLGSLGRMDDLKGLFAETSGRVFDGGPLQQQINAAKEGYHLMLTMPGSCFKCGTFALMNLGRELKGASFPIKEIDDEPSPRSGFSMTRLVELAKAAGLDVVPTRWDDAKTIVAPSIIHWRQDHYAVILKESRGDFLVADPTFGKQRWLTTAEIREEASGNFMIAANSLPAGWQRLPKSDTDRIYGRGTSTGVGDGTDSCGNGSGGGDPPAIKAQASSGAAANMAWTACSTCSGGGGGGSGRPQQPPSPPKPPNPPGCQTCDGSDNQGAIPYQAKAGAGTAAGSAIWYVSEPYVNVWLYDQPLGTLDPGLGYQTALTLAYKQRDARTLQTNIFGLGPQWECSWLSYITDDDKTHFSSATAQLPAGGTRTYVPDNVTTEYFSHTVLERETNTLGELKGFTIHYANGHADQYHFVPSSVSVGLLQAAFLTARIDPYGHQTQFLYQETNASVRLLYVVDGDSRTNFLSYTNTAFPTQVTGVQDPFGRNAWLQYNNNGVLTNIVDAIGLFSAFSYDSQGWVTNLTTPYGTTTFEHFVNTDAPTNEFNNANPYHFIRAVRIKDPSGGTNVYMLRQDSSRVYTNSTDFEYFSPPFDYYNEPSWATPDQALGFEILATYRDSFFWGPRQAASLPVDLATVSATQLYQARMRHWLHDTDSYFISQTLGMQLEPSADGGQTMGQSVWYAYYGANGMFSGTNSIPALIGLMLPDQTPSYTWYRSDIWGHPTNIVQTYSTVFGETPFGEIPTTRTNQYIYDANGIDLVRIVGPEGETIAGYHYDANHQVTFVTNAVGDLTTFMYDSQGRLTSSRTAAGLTTTNIYFPSGAYTNWVQTAIDLEISRTNSWTYTNDLVLTHTDERGLTTTFAYDNLQRPTVASDSRGTIYYYYNKLDLSQVSDRMGLGTWFGYDAVRRLTAVTNALGYYTLYNYCSCGALDSIQDALTNVTSFYYDSAGRLTNTTYADGYVLSRQLDLLGRVIIQTDSGGISKTNWFNNQGLLYAISNAAGNVTTFTVDLEDRAINHVDGNGVTTVGTYDNLGRMLTRSYPDGGVEYLGYSAAGLAAYTNQLGFVTRYYYDAARRKTAETNANTEGIEYTYNAAGDLLTLTDGKGQVTTWHADQWGRITNKLDQSGTEILRYTYDPDNRLTNRWSVAKGNTAYSYDDMGNLTLINYPASHDVTFTYDPLNRVTNMVDGVGTTVYTYTSTGQVLSEDGPFASDTVTNGYSNRLRTGLGLQQPTGEWTNGFTLDGARRFATITSPAGTFTYHPLSGVQNLVAGISLPNLSFITNFFDGDARLTATYLENSTYSVLDSAVYGYNQGNQRTAFTNAAGTYVQYSYDNIGQLKVAASSSSTENRGYTYDPAWNLNWLTNNGSTYNFLVDTKNELTNAYSSTYGYDGNGNLISGTNSHTSFVYDDENRLIQWFWYAAGSSSCSNGALRTDFVYDGLGRLRKRTEYSIAGTIGGGGGGGAPPPGPPPPGGAGCSWGTGTETRYIYDGMRVIQERNGSNNPQVAYTRGPDLSGTLEGAGGIGGLLARSDQYSSGNPTRHNYYHADGNGNITYLVDSSQALAARYRYDPFGNTIASGGTLAVSNVYRFSSKEIHVNSGMYCYLYRFYDPNLERWLNRDPLGERGFETLRREGGGQIITDHFGFVANNPVSKFDPQGLKIWVCTVAADPPLPKGSTHTYLWDDRPGIPQGNRECGKESSSGSGTSGNSSNNTGPTNGETGDPWHGTGAKGNTECYPVDDSDGSEAAVMSCCNPAAPGPHMNDGPFLPYLNDCHNAVDDCLKAHGLNPPPHSRGDPISNHIKDIECACRP